MRALRFLKLRVSASEPAQLCRAGFSRAVMLAKSKRLQPLAPRKWNSHAHSEGIRMDLQGNVFRSKSKREKIPVFPSRYSAPTNATHQNRVATRSASYISSRKIQQLTENISLNGHGVIPVAYLRNRRNSYLSPETKVAHGVQIRGVCLGPRNISSPLLLPHFSFCTRILPAHKPAFPYSASPIP